MRNISRCLKIRATTVNSHTWRNSCTHITPALPSKRTSTQRENRTVIYYSISEANRTKICACERAFSPANNRSCTFQSETRENLIKRRCAEQRISSNNRSTEEGGKDEERIAKMSRMIREYLSVLKRIVRMKDNARQSFLKKCDKEIIDCFSECAKNVLKSNVPLKKRQYECLRRQKKNVRALARKGTSLRVKRRIVQQRGGFLASLLVPAITALGSVLAGQLLPSSSST